MNRYEIRTNNKKQSIINTAMMLIKGNRVLLFVPVLLIFIASLAACSAKKTDNRIPVSERGTPSPTVSTTDSSSAEAEIIVSSPVTLSFNPLYPINGKEQYLMLRMVEGEYYEDWNPGPLFGSIWKGRYSIEIADEYFKTLARTDLCEFFSEPLIFTSSFEIEFDDYNNDGDPDFTLGQYGTSNGNNFRLFTLREDGSVELLPIKDFHSLFISNLTSYYSTKLIKLSDTEFSKQCYDNAEGKIFEDTFKWEGTEFVHVESKVITEYTPLQ